MPSSLAHQRDGLLLAGAVDREEHRHFRLELLPGLDHAVGHHVGAREGAAEIDHQAFHAGIGQHQIERDLGLGVGLAADLEEIRRPAAVMADHVHGRHGQPGAVRQHADIAVELDQLEAGLGAALFELGHRAGRRRLWRSRPGGRARASSSMNLQSSATTRPSASSASGLISSSSASRARKARRAASRICGDLRLRGAEIEAVQAWRRCRARAARCRCRPAGGGWRRASRRRSPRYPCRLRSKTGSAACAPRCRAARRHRTRARSWPAPRPARARPCSRRCVMPRICRGGCLGFLRRVGELDAAGLAALAGRHLRLDHAGADAAPRPPRLPRAQAQDRRAAPGCRPGASTSAFAACSSKFITVSACRISSSRRRTVASSLGLSSGMVVTRWVMLRKFL